MDKSDKISKGSSRIRFLQRPNTAGVSKVNLNIIRESHSHNAIQELSLEKPVTTVTTSASCSGNGIVLLPDKTSSAVDLVGHDSPTKITSKAKKLEKESRINLVRPSSLDENSNLTANSSSRTPRKVGACTANMGSQLDRICGLENFGGKSLVEDFINQSFPVAKMAIGYDGDQQLKTSSLPHSGKIKDNEKACPPRSKLIVPSSRGKSRTLPHPGRILDISGISYSLSSENDVINGNSRESRNCPMVSPEDTNFGQEDGRQVPTSPGNNVRIHGFPSSNQNLFYGSSSNANQNLNFSSSSDHRSNSGSKMTSPSNSMPSVNQRNAGNKRKDTKTNNLEEFRSSGSKHVPESNETQHGSKENDSSRLRSVRTELTESNSSGPEPTRSGSEPTRSGSELTRSGSESTRSRSEPTRSGSEPNRSGSEPTRSGSEPTRSGSESISSGSEPTRSGFESTRSGSESTRSGSEPTRSGSTTPSSLGPGSTRQICVVKNISASNKNPLTPTVIENHSSADPTGNNEFSMNNSRLASSDINHDDLNRNKQTGQENNPVEAMYVNLMELNDPQTTDHITNLRKTKQNNVTEKTDKKENDVNAQSDLILKPMDPFTRYSNHPPSRFAQRYMIGSPSRRNETSSNIAGKSDLHSNWNESGASMTNQENSLSARNHRKNIDSGYASDSGTFYISRMHRQLHEGLKTVRECVENGTIPSDNTIDGENSVETFKPVQTPAPTSLSSSSYGSMGSGKISVLRSFGKLENDVEATSEHQFSRGSLERVTLPRVNRAISDDDAVSAMSRDGADRKFVNTDGNAGTRKLKKETQDSEMNTDKSFLVCQAKLRSDQDVQVKETNVKGSFQCGARRASESHLSNQNALCRHHLDEAGHSSRSNRSNSIPDGGDSSGNNLPSTMVAKQNVFTKEQHLKTEAVSGPDFCKAIENLAKRNKEKGNKAGISVSRDTSTTSSGSIDIGERLPSRSDYFHQSLPRSSKMFQSERLSFEMTDLALRQAGLQTNSMSRRFERSHSAIQSASLPVTPKRSFSQDDDSDLHASMLSLISSASSSVYSTTEEKQSQEIRKLKYELDAAQEKINSLTSQLNTNIHVVTAFEQSLSNMTNRLQKLTKSSELKDMEINKLRITLEELQRQKNNCFEYRQPLSMLTLPRAGDVSGSIWFNRNHSTSLDHESSLSSLSALETSLNSVGELHCDSLDKKQKKKSWLKLGTSFRKAFSQNKRKNSSDTEVDPTNPADVDIPRSLQFLPNGSTPRSVPSTPMISQRKPLELSLIEEPSCRENDVILNLKQQLHEKDMKLTDIRLEALSSAHQLEQLREAMNQTKLELNSIKAENERMQRILSEKGFDSRDPGSWEKGTNDKRKIDISDLSSFEMMSVDAGKKNSPVYAVVVRLPQTTSHASQKMEFTEISIGNVSLTSRTKWETLDSTVHRIFQEHVNRLDPSTSLGLNASSILHYSVGEINRSKGAAVPELLPCGYLVGLNTTIVITLQGTSESSLDMLAFETLIPKGILQRHVALLMEHRRLMICGPSGTGKTYLAHKLAKHLVQMSERESKAGAISTFNVDSKSGRELRQYLTNVLEQVNRSIEDKNCSTESPLVIILDNLHHVSSFEDAFNEFLDFRHNKCPYIIGTMIQAGSTTSSLQLHHNFRWILCTNHTEPVKGFLGRYLQRRLIQDEVSSGRKTSSSVNKIIHWLPGVWTHINKFLERHCSTESAIGPMLFMSCPLDVDGLQVWFADLWNYSVVPYLLEALRESIQKHGQKGAWEDPALWVTENSPWLNKDSLSSLLHVRPEDVGFYLPDIQSNEKSIENGSVDSPDKKLDPLLNMLQRLQEAATSNTSPAPSSDATPSDSDNSSLYDKVTE